MQLSSLSLFLTTLLPVVLALDGTGTKTTAKEPSATKSSSSSDPTHTILVGSEGLTFTPNVTTAAVGSTLEFHFFPKTHSVAQSSFASPCVPNTSGTSFFSGGFVTASGENATTFSVKVNATTPIWFYCGYPGHCEKGMVGAVNVPADGSKTLEQFKAAALKVGSTVQPPAVAGGIFAPAGAGSTGTGSSGGATSTSTASEPDESGSTKTGTKTAGSPSQTASTSSTGSAASSSPSGSGAVQVRNKTGWIGIIGAVAGAVCVGMLMG